MFLLCINGMAIMQQDDSKDEPLEDQPLDLSVKSSEEHYPKYIATQGSVSKARPLLVRQEEVHEIQMGKPAEERPYKLKDVFARRYSTKTIDDQLRSTQGQKLKEKSSSWGPDATTSMQVDVGSMLTRTSSTGCTPTFMQVTTKDMKSIEPHLALPTFSTSRMYTEPKYSKSFDTIHEYRTPHPPILKSPSADFSTGGPFPTPEVDVPHTLTAGQAKSMKTYSSHSYPESDVIGPSKFQWPTRQQENPRKTALHESTSYAGRTHSERPHIFHNPQQSKPLTFVSRMPAAASMVGSNILSSGRLHPSAFAGSEAFTGKGQFERGGPQEVIDRVKKMKRKAESLDLPEEESTSGGTPSPKKRSPEPLGGKQFFVDPLDLGALKCVSPVSQFEEEFAARRRVYLTQLEILRSKIPSDPHSWTREDVHTWLAYMKLSHNMQAIRYERFLMNGKALCLMSQQMFLQRVPMGGKMLFKDFQLRLAKSLRDAPQGRASARRPPPSALASPSPIHTATMLPAVDTQSHASSSTAPSYGAEAVSVTSETESTQGQLPLNLTPQATCLQTEGEVTSSGSSKSPTPPI